MAGAKEIKRRIKSVKNTKKITKAMELVAVSKMKRAVASTLRSRLYAEYSWEILTSIAKNVEKIIHPFFNEREVKNILLILITSNRGLCGAYNAQVIKKTINFIKKFGSDAKKTRVDILSIGKKGLVSMMRLGKSFMTNRLYELPDNISISDVLPIVKDITDEYIAGSYDKVYVAYTDFISTLTQKPNIKQVLPISETEALLPMDGSKASVSTGGKIDYLFEGDQDKFIGSLAEKITRMQIYQMILESNASEQSSRMIAMKNASDASGEMINDLTLIFNKARQANITREISEISAGMASVN